MREDSICGFLVLYFKNHRQLIAVHAIAVAVFVVVYSLYSMQFEPLIYALTLAYLVAAIFVIYDFIKLYQKHNALCLLAKQVSADLGGLPPVTGLIEADYQNILRALYDEKTDLVSRIDIKQTEMLDYYTLWAHQIKTPIAAMKLLLQCEPNGHSKELLEQIIKIEQYVEMVLGYLKIDSLSSDLLLERRDLLGIVKQAVRKFAHLFIKRNIALNLKEMNCNVLTDEKWLVFVIEQILSNALKYTQKGRISIYMEEGAGEVLVIEDTGIGIAEEDLPRVFEKGFTGYNGRMDKKATGIGLYLCKKILDKLSHTITITSQVGVGTTVKIDLSSANAVFE